MKNTGKNLRLGIRDLILYGFIKIFVSSLVSLLVTAGFSLRFLKKTQTKVCGYHMRSILKKHRLKPATTNLIASFLILLFSNCALAQPKILNIYACSNYLSDGMLAKFTKATGIKVNLTEYDNNETMYAKLKASKNIGYDIILPSNYYIDRLAKQNMLHQIDKSRLANFHNLNPALLNKAFDPENKFSIPYFWGSSAIIINTKYIKRGNLTRWQDFWQPEYQDQLLMLNDMRDVFNVALLSLGYSVNESNPKHITQAYLKLKKLLPNIKIFSADAVPNVYVDEDAVVGMAWNGDCRIASQENSNLEYIYPQDGFAVWIDSFAILKNATNLENAYKFLDFILKPEISQEASLLFGYATANLAAMKLMPKNLQNNPMFNPSKEILKRSQIQVDISDQAKRMYEKYWEQLKIGD